MLILMLDIDGVLNSWQSIHYFNYAKDRGFILEKGGHENLCPIAISNLNCLMEEYPQMKIVISSTRRKYNTQDEIKSILTRNDFLYSDRIIGRTGEIPDGCRGDEIDAYVKKHGATVDLKEFIIIDDDDDMGTVMDHLIQTDQRVGFDFISFHRCLSYLESKGFKPSGKTGVCAL